MRQKRINKSVAEAIEKMKFESILMPSNFSQNSQSIGLSFSEVRQLSVPCNGTRTHNHLVRKRTLNHLAKLAK